MTDYRLDSLSPRLFEHMVQALAVGAITSTVTPFGDGPDGGREATFEGATDYGPENDRWNGYGVIQAKYHIRPQDPGRDGKWACNELKKELRQYTREEDPRPVPRYFIFATNVVLSPGESAGKDQVRKILDEFAEGRNVEFDIWDYDKLRVLIDRDKAVRRSYLAWITPSDVLAELCGYLGARRRDYYKLILRYLQRELLADQFARLEQAGHSADEAIPLSQVFIDLPTTLKPAARENPPRHDPDEGLRFAARVVVESGISLREKGSEKHQQKADPAPNVPQYDRIGRQVLIGGPGQGKTTLAQYICQVFRCAILADVSRTRLDPDVQNTLHDFMETWTRQGYPIPSARRLPFRIVLSDFAKKLAAGDVRGLMGYLASKLCANTDISITAEEIEKIISDYPTIIILDGLDEVPSSTNRDDVMSAVTNFSIDVATGDLDTYLIATTRPQGYNDEFSPRQYLHHYLTPLTEADALAYGNKLARIRFGGNIERFNKVSNRLSRAVEKPATAKLMETPLQVTILTLLVDRMGDPPEERWNLFREYYQLIYERETERDIASVQVLKEHHLDVDAIHRRVGIALQVESERSGGTDARLTIAQFGQIVEDYLLEEGHTDTEMLDLKGQIIDAAANRLVFLVGLEAGRVGFEIRSLQEFMAAEGIIDGSDETIRDRLRAIASSSHWRNVFLFAAGKCFSDRRYLRDTIQAICAELNDDPDDESLRILLVGSRLALDLLEDGPARKTPLTRSSLTRLALQLLGTPFRDVSRIAAVCEGATRYMYLEDLRERLRAEDSISSRQAWMCLAILIDRYGDDFENLAREILGSRDISDDEARSAIEVASGRNSWLAQTLFDILVKRVIPLDNVSAGTGDPADFEENDGVRHLGPWEIPGYPQWLEWYLSYLNLRYTFTEGTQVRILGLDTRPAYYISFNRLHETGNRSLITPPGLPETGNWEFFHCISRFCQEPTPASLAAALRAGGSPSLDSAFRKIFPHNFPWPLAELFFVQQADSESGIAESVESGVYGGLSEWSALERRLVDGLSIRELLNEPMLCETSDGGLFTFPFRTASISARLSPPTPRTSADTEELLNAFDDGPSPVIRQFFSDLLVSGVTPRVPPEGTWVDRVLYFRCSHSKAADVLFYTLARQVDLHDPKWSALFLDRPPTFYNMPASYISSSVLSTLASVGEEGEQYRGLFVPLATGLIHVSTTIRDRILSDLSVAVEGPSSLQTAAIMINLMAGRKVREFGREIESLIDACPGAFKGILEAVQVKQLGYHQEREELMDLARIAHKDRAGSWSFLGRNFERRPSMLLGAGEWGRLEFPSSMCAVLGLGS